MDGQSLDQLVAQNATQSVPVTERVQLDEVVAQPEAQQPQEAPQQESLPDRQAKNFRALKQNYEDAEARARAAEARARELEAKLSTLPEDDEININADDLAEGKHVTKLARKLKTLEKQVQESNARAAALSLENALQKEMPDIFQVVTQENAAKLREIDPEEADLILSIQDPHKQMKAAYKRIKAILPQQQQASQINQYEQELANHNRAKPRFADGIAGATNGGIAPGFTASDNYQGPLTKELSKKYYQELLDAKRRRN